MINKIRFLIAAGLGKLAFKLSRILGRGSGEQIQGRIIDLLCPSALKTVAKNRKIIVVSATNGKTTTTRLIARAFSEKYPDVVSNALGANQRAGVIAALVNAKQNSTDAPQFAILEVDERSLPGMFKELNPKLLVLGNLSRDQLDRFGEVSSISQSWKKMLEGSKVNVIANGCDPHIVFAVDQLNDRQLTFVDLKSKWHDDSHSCPKCGDLFEWDEESHFHSPTCSFETPKSLVSPDQRLVSQIKDSISLPGSWNQSNAFLAYVSCKKYDLEDEMIFNSWKDVLEVSGRNAIFNLDDDRTVQLFLAKNPAGWNETLRYISDEPADATIFAFNCNIADGKDPSWLYDVDFENAILEHVTVFGERATDMEVRLCVAGKEVNVANGLKEALAHNAFAKHTNLVASYTQFLTLSRMLPKLSKVEMEVK